MDRIRQKRIQLQAIPIHQQWSAHFYLFPARAQNIGENEKDPFRSDESKSFCYQ
jgi:hypothetical protein